MVRNWNKAIGGIVGAMLIVMTGCPELELADNAIDDSNDDAAIVDQNTNATSDTDSASVSAGATIYTDNGCATCHGDDATGGIGPSIRDATVSNLDNVLRSTESSHPGGTVLDLSDQALVDLASFLAASTSASSDDTSDNTATLHTVDAAESGVLHGIGLSDPSTNCTACHGADLFGMGSAPACWGCHGSIWNGPPDYPPTHTRNEDGFRHALGLEFPIGDCDACHGADLTGTPLIPSCFACHGAKWNDGEDSGDDGDDNGGDD